MATTSIEWTNTPNADGTTSVGQVWNPTVGCSKISAGCKNCYALRLHNRLRAMGQEKYKDPFTTVKPHPESLDLPLRRKKPGTYFVNSMSDLFHEDLPLEYIRQVFDVMNRAHWHTFQVLTKRGNLLSEYDYSRYLKWTPNIWMGVSVESIAHRYRIDQLRRTGAHVKFLSIEPMLGLIPNLNLKGIDWVIVGGESGPKKRPFEADWARSVRDDCERQRVAFFMKQMDKVQPIPDDLMIRQYPQTI